MMLVPPRFAVKILPSEWKDNPVVTTLPKIQKALSEGLELPGNLIVTRDNEIVKEASNIFSAFGCQDKKLTVAVVGAQATGPSVCVWWSQAKTQGGSPQRVQLKLVQIGRGPGPTLKPPAVTNIPKPVGDKLVTIRFLAPAFYRKYIPGVCQEDSPKTIIAAWAQMTGCQASSFTGGRWEIATHAHGKILIGHVKMTKVQADKCLPLSGRNALFVTQVPPEDGRKGVAWIPRNAAPLEEYFRQALTQAQTRKAPLVIRQGGGSDLGIVGVDPAEFSKHQIKMWELFNAPRHWTHDDVKEFVSKIHGLRPKLSTKSVEDLTKFGFSRPKQLRAKVMPRILLGIIKIMTVACISPSALCDPGRASNLRSSNWWLQRNDGLIRIQLCLLLLLLNWMTLTLT